VGYSIGYGSVHFQGVHIGIFYVNINSPMKMNGNDIQQMRHGINPS
jgi:hypothetical protein